MLCLDGPSLKRSLEGWVVCCISVVVGQMYSSCTRTPGGVTKGWLEKKS